MILRTLLFSLFFLPLLSFAQTDCACCTPAHQQFNFWVGDWNVYNTDGDLVGENTIVKLEDNCILNEHWRGTKGSTGRSYNYYDKKTEMWHQLWIDNKGGNLKLSGKASPGKMILKSELTPNKEGKLYYNQISWTLNGDETVTQTWEYYSEDHKLLGLAFKGVYRKK